MPKILLPCLIVVVLLASVPPCAQAADDGFNDSVILIVRHAEKSETTDGLTPAGEARARAYATYFRNYKIHGLPLKIDAVFAAADSATSHRPRITMEPAAKALGLAVNASFKNKNYQELVDDLRGHYRDKHVVICWHHGEIPDLLRALGASPEALLPGGTWPVGEYDWLLELHYDATGNLKEARRVSEGLTGSR